MNHKKSVLFVATIAFLVLAATGAWAYVNSDAAALECAFGLRTKDGSNYAVDVTSINLGVLQDMESAERIAVAA